MLEIVELGGADAAFADCLAIRLAVFVGEQNVPVAQEQDEYDATARHFLARLNGQPAGTARVLQKPGNTMKITRVAVLQAARGQSIGVTLMRHIEASIPAAQFVLDAQTHAANFYHRLGYSRVGEEFLEAGIPHIHMRKSAGATMHSSRK